MFHSNARTHFYFLNINHIFLSHISMHYFVLNKFYGQCSSPYYLQNIIECRKIFDTYFLVACLRFKRGVIDTQNYPTKIRYISGTTGKHVQNCVHFGWKRINTTPVELLGDYFNNFRNIIVSLVNAQKPYGIVLFWK